MKSLLRIVFLCFLAVPAIAIWCPVPIGLSNLLRVWSWFYSALVLLIGCLNFITCFSDGKKILLGIVQSRNSFWMWWNFLLRGVWVVGIFYKGWWISGLPLVLVWFGVPMLGWIGLQIAKHSLEEMGD